MKLYDFDKIYVLHLSDRKDRYEHIKSEFKRIKLFDAITIWWTCKRPISTICGNAIESLHTSGYDNLIKRNKNIYAGVFNCALEHYTMIKTSYERGFNNILIFEDDVIFYKDREYFDKCLDQIPENYGVCKLYHSYSTGLEYFNNSKPAFKLTNPKTYKGVQSTVAYCLDRNGMQKMIESYNDKFTCADFSFIGLDEMYINDCKILYTKNSKSDVLY